MTQRIHQNTWIHLIPGCPSILWCLHSGSYLLHQMFLLCVIDLALQLDLDVPLVPLASASDDPVNYSEPALPDVPLTPAVNCDPALPDDPCSISTCQSARSCTTWSSSGTVNLIRTSISDVLFLRLIQRCSSNTKPDVPDKNSYSV
jgi:hypothetical protein